MPTLPPDDDGVELQKLIDAGRFAQAAIICREMLARPLAPINEAVTLANLVTCCDKNGDAQGVLDAGRRAIEVIDSANLWWERGADGIATRDAIRWQRCLGVAGAGSR